MEVWPFAILLIIIGTGFSSGYSRPRYVKNSHKLQMLGIFMTILFLFGAFSVKGESYFWSIVSFSVFFWFVGVLIGEISQPPPKPEPEPELEPEPEPEPDPSLSLRERIEEIKKRTRN